jgi:cytidine deaminase
MTIARKARIASSQLDELLNVARHAAKSAYSPYSKFRVGAAVSAGGKTYVGCNVENASYGLTICAERVAIFSAIADGNKVIDMLAVSCVDAKPTDEKNLKMPCGACRQVLEEFASNGARIIVDGVGEFTKDELLPVPFRLKL